MADHCPFLNRKDARCGKAFRLDGLSYTFDHCFSDYGTCPTYAQMLGERQEKRAHAATLTATRPNPLVTLHIKSRKRTTGIAA